MIFIIKKNIYKEFEDCLIKPIDSKLMFKITTLKNGYYLYNHSGEQIGQIIYEKGMATITVPESPSMLLVRAGDSYSIMNKQLAEEEKREIINNFSRKENKNIFMIYGTPVGYKYDIYEKGIASKMPSIVASVIPDVNDNENYKVRINEGGNVLKLLMMAVAIDKLNSDPESKF